MIAPFSRSCFARLLNAVEAAVAAGQLRNDVAARPMAEALLSACHGAISMRIANPYAPWTEPEVLSKVLLDGLFQGFEPSARCGAELSDDNIRPGRLAGG